MSGAKVWHMAQCRECGDQPRYFSSHEARGDWVGSHRVKTGHHVGMWLQAA